MGRMVYFIHRKVVLEFTALVSLCRLLVVSGQRCWGNNDKMEITSVIGIYFQKNRNYLKQNSLERLSNRLNFNIHLHWTGIFLLMRCRGEVYWSVA